jgi:hypothetical protein
MKTHSNTYRGLRAFSGALAIVFAASCADQVAGPAPEVVVASREHADDVLPMTLTWQQTSRDLAQKYAPSAPTFARTFGLLGVAQYAAVMARHDGDDGEIEFSHGTPGQGRTASDRGAVAAASAAVLSYIYPAEATAMGEKLRVQREAEGGQPNQAFERGEALGMAAAQMLIDRARTDGFGAPWTGTIPTGGDRNWFSAPGVAPALPTLGKMKPFVLDSGSQFRPGPPPSATSPVYLNDLAQVKAYSAMPSSDPVRAAQIAIAQKWAAVSNLGYWGQRTAGLVQSAGFGEREAAHTFALAGAAGTDAHIGCWDAKYTYFLWRPVHADPTIVRAIPMPNHPSYPSGHSCNSAAIAEVLTAIFPAEAQALQAEVVEAGNSRVWGGIHYPFDCTTGQELGRNVARYILEVDSERGILQSLR